MGFRGIDPDGLHQLSAQLFVATRGPSTLTRSGLDILTRHGFGAAAASLASTCGHVAVWGEETSVRLSERAELIRACQESPRNPHLWIAAGFVTEAPLEQGSFQDWVARLERVERAVADISAWLDQSWRDWDVTNHDLHNIAETLEQLDGSELRQVVAALSPRQLQRWIEEMGNRINGFSQAEKQRVFAMLAANGDGGMLDAIHQATLTAGSDEDLIDFGRAVGIHSPDQVIVDFVDLAMKHDLVHTPQSTLAPLLAASTIDDEGRAAAAAAIIAGSDQLVEIAIIDSLASFNPDLAGPDFLASIGSILSRGNDSAAVAEAFATLATAALRPEGLYPILADRYRLSSTQGVNIGNEVFAMVIDGEPTLLRAATAVLTAEGDAVVTQLATTIDPDGVLLSDFLFELIAGNRIVDVGLIADSIRGGPDVNAARFGDIGDVAGYPYAHAANLGYTAGVFCNALDRYADRAKSTNAALSVLASAAFFVAGALLNATSTAAALLGSAAEYGATGWVGGNVQDDIDTELKQVEIAVEAAFRPDTDATMAPIPGQAWEEWIESLSAIRRSDLSTD